jgi:hypothetical protein
MHGRRRQSGSDIELTGCLRGITDARPDLVNIDQSANPLSLILTRGDFAPPEWRLDPETFLYRYPCSAD